MTLYKRVVDEISSGKAETYTPEELTEIDTFGFRLCYFFSLFPETIFIANEVNRLRMTGMRARLFFIGLVPKRKRKAYWPAVRTDDKNRIRAVSRYLNVSPARAKIIMRNMTPDLIRHIQSIDPENPNAN